MLAAGAWVVKPRTKTGEQRIVGVDPATIERLRSLHAGDVMGRLLEV